MSEIAGVSPAVLAFCFFAIATGSAVQRLSGQGFGLVSTPLVALVAPHMLPSAILLLGFASGLGSSALDLKHVTRSELPAGFTGRTLGAIVAASVASLLPFEQIAGLAALVVLLAVALSLSGLTCPITHGSLLVAGFLAGIMGTLTAVGAPPMAMLYQTEEPSRSRAMQSTFFFFGMVVSIGALAFHGLITRDHVRFALVLLPAVVFGILVSQPLAKRFSKRMVRPAALVFSGTAALILLAKILTN